MTLQAPFPWFGGKAKVAATIWDRLGLVQNYVEPFFGSGAVLLSRPEPFPGVETINDACGFVANFWRAIQAAPEEVAAFADWPVNEADLEARHYWLVTEGRETLARILGDPHGFEAKIAGWWCWGLCAWIGSGWCSGEGPWRWEGEWRQLPHLSAGRGINRKLPHLSAGRGINRKLPHVGDAGQGIHGWFDRLCARLRSVRVCHGDWSRVTGDTVTWRHGLTGVFLDPPYGAEAGRTDGLYATDDLTVALKAREWALEAGKRPDMRICLAGYEGEHDMPGWSTVRWKAKGGYGSQGEGRGRENAERETLWFSPHCLAGRQGDLFSYSSAFVGAAE